MHSGAIKQYTKYPVLIYLINYLYCEKMIEVGLNNFWTKIF